MRHLRPFFLRHQAKLDQILGFVWGELVRFRFHLLLLWWKMILSPDYLGHTTGTYSSWGKKVYLLQKSQSPWCEVKEWLHKSLFLSRHSPTNKKPWNSSIFSVFKISNTPRCIDYNMFVDWCIGGIIGFISSNFGYLFVPVVFVIWLLWVANFRCLTVGVDLQVKFISLHQAEIQLGKTCVMKVLAGGMNVEHTHGSYISI